jgi:AcrR family transcriptional regulator
VTESPAQTPAVREIARDAVRAHVTAVAVSLFEAHGFDNVAIEHLSEAAGISRRTFHRYFAAKEDVIVGDPARMGELVRDALLGRPAVESAWTSLRLAYTELFAQLGGDSDQGKRMIRLMAGTAALRARNLEKHLQWAEALAPIIEDRLDGYDRHVRAQTLVHASLACLDLALLTWAQSTDETGIGHALARVFATFESN